MLIDRERINGISISDVIEFIVSGYDMLESEYQTKVLQKKKKKIEYIHKAVKGRGGDAQRERK